MTGRELITVLNGRPIGAVERGRNARLRFVYAEDWRTSAQAFPLSLSMPLAAAEHEHAAIEAFLWGLLPDNEAVLERWAKRFQVSARNAYGLHRDGLRHPLVARLRDALAARTKRCVAALR